jgi:hypothetical protein
LESKQFNLRPYSKRREKMIELIYESMENGNLFIDKYPVMPI